MEGPLFGTSCTDPAIGTRAESGNKKIAVPPQGRRRETDRYLLFLRCAHVATVEYWMCTYLYIRTCHSVLGAGVIASAFYFMWQCTNRECQGRSSPIIPQREKKIRGGLCLTPPPLPTLSFLPLFWPDHGKVPCQGRVKSCSGNVGSGFVIKAVQFTHSARGQ